MTRRAEPALPAQDTGLALKELPLWRGLQDRPGDVMALPFELAWDERGFLRQSTTPDVRRRVLEAYASDDYRFITPPPGSSAWGNRLGDANIAAALEVLGPLDGLRVLEVGAGSLYVARRLFERFDLAGYVVVDPALRDGGADLPGLEVIADFFPVAGMAPESAEVVLSFSCLEHVADPVDFLTEVERLMAPGGSAVLTFPDVSRQFRDGDLNVLLHEHMSYLDAQSVARIAQRAGLTVSRLDSANDLFTCHLTKGRPARRRPVQESLPLDAFGHSLATASARVQGCLARGERIAFHGANNGLNAFLYLAGLDRRDDLLVFDGDVAKRDRYLPACGVPVRHAGDGSYRSVDRVLVAATSFFDEIRSGLVGDQGIPPEAISPLFGVPAA